MDFKRIKNKEGFERLAKQEVERRNGVFRYKDNTTMNFYFNGVLTTHKVISLRNKGGKLYLYTYVNGRFESDPLHDFDFKEIKDIVIVMLQQASERK